MTVASLVGRDYDPPPTLHLIDLATKQEALSFTHYDDPFGFDPQGNLLWVEMSFEGIKSGLATAKLMRWNPKTIQKNLVYECTQPLSFRTDINLYFDRLGRGRQYCLLSPDCRTWLIPHHQGNNVTYELIDVPSGRVRTRLALPEINIKSPFTNWLQADFSNDGKWLLIQTQEPQVEVRFRLCWFDVETGEQLHSLLLPVSEQSESQSGNPKRGEQTERTKENSVVGNSTHLHRLLYFTKDHLVAQTTLARLNANFHKPGLTFIKPFENKITQIEFEEFKPTPDKWQIEDKKGGRITSFQFDCHVTEDSKSLTTSTQYPMVPDGTHNNIIMQGYLPFHSFSVRSLEDGKLENSFRLYFGNHDEGDYWDWANVLLTYLPNQRVLIKRTIDRPGGKIDERIEKAREWLKMDRSRNRVTMLYLLNAKTGSYDFTFPLKQDIDQALLLPNQTQLLLCRSDEAGVWIDTYDYPLHKPWLLILSWSFGIAIGMTLLVESRRWWKRRGLAKSNRHLQRSQ